MKISLSLLTILLITTVAFAKNITIKGTYLGSKCGDLCYMDFKTSKGIVNLYGYVEDYKNIKKGRKYTVVYERMHIQVAELGKINVNGIITVKINISDGRSKSTVKTVKNGNIYLDKIKKQCKENGPPYCYLSKRYKVFEKACIKGDGLSCRHKKDIEVAFKNGVEGGDVTYLQSIHYISNNAKTSNGK